MLLLATCQRRECNSSRFIPVDVNNCLAESILFPHYIPTVTPMFSKSAFACIILFFVSGYSYCQDMTGKDIRDHMLIDLSKKVDHRVDDFEGSPFLSEDFVVGDVYSNQKSYRNILLRYNIFNDNMEFKQNNTTYALYPEPRITKVRLEDEIYVVEKHEVKGKMIYGYLERLDSGKVILLSKKIVRFTEKQDPKALESASKPARFTRTQDEYYYKIDNGEVSKVGSLKNLIESLPDKKDDVTSYAKKEKISTRNEAELLKLVKYYNSL
jgi:hypothetical protein